MIFSKNQLLPEDDGKFATLWTANARGIAFVKKKDVLKVNLFQLCEDISKMVDYETAHSNKCLSIGLAASLLHGMFIICNKRVAILLDDVLRFTISLKCFETLQFTRPDEGEKPIGRKRKHAAKLNNGGTVSNEAEVVALAESITMAEQPDEPIVDTWQKETLAFGDFGAFVNELDPLIQSGAAIPMMNDVEMPTTHEAIEAERIPTKKRKQQDHVSTPAKKRVLESSVVAIQEDPDKPESPLREVRDNATANLNAMDSVIPEVTFPNFDIQDKPKQHRAVNPSRAFCTITISKKNINEQMSFSQEIFEKKPPAFRRFPQCATASVADLLSILFQEEENEVYRKKASLSQGESLLKGSPRHTTFNLKDPSIMEIQREEHSPVLEEMHLQQLTVVVDVHAPHSSGPRISNLEGIEDIPAVAENSAANVPLEVEPFVHAEESPIEEPRNLEEIVLNETSARRAMSHQRHKLIRHIVKYWNYEVKGPISIENVCPKPINRFNIAVTFGDLLSMSKHGYVVLNCDEETLELTTIEKGWKLLEN